MKLLTSLYINSSIYDKKETKYITFYYKFNSSVLLRRSHLPSIFFTSNPFSGCGAKNHNIEAKISFTTKNIIKQNISQITSRLWQLFRITCLYKK